MEDLEAASKRVLRLTGDRARAEDVVQETLLRARQHPEVADDSERSARAWLFTVARNMIIDERRSPRSRDEMSALDGSGTPERVGPDQVNAAPLFSGRETVDYLLRQVLTSSPSALVTPPWRRRHFPSEGPAHIRQRSGCVAGESARGFYGRERGRRRRIVSCVPLDH